MDLLKSFIKKHFCHFTYFYTHLRHRIWIALGLSILVGLLDGFGLAMFIPMLEMVGDGGASAEGLGNLAFLINGLTYLGLELNLITILTTLVFFFTLKGIAKFAESYYKVIVQQYFNSKLRIDNVDKLTHYQYKSFVTSDAGRIQNTLSGETERVAGAYRYYIQTLQSAIMLTVYVFLAFLANPQFALLVAIGGLISNFLFKQLYRRTNSVSKNITRDAHGYQGLLIQKVSFFKYLKATSMNEKFAEKLKKSILSIEANNRKIGFYGSILEASREPLTIIVVVGVILVETQVFNSGLGLIILSLLFFFRSLTYLMHLQTVWNSFLNVSGSLENMKVFQKEMALSKEYYASKKLKGVYESIELKNLKFEYGEKEILKNINLKLEAKKTYAFVGGSGSGKTTLVNLIVALMPTNSGCILIDGQDLKCLDIRSYQSKIGYITQEPVIFNDTIFNNVTFWALPSNENIERFWDALEKAAIADFVKELSLQEKELLGNNGINLSGGQRQRLSIARELFKNIDVLVMDEATSALDVETEIKIQESVEKLKGKMTILIVAHRLSTIKNADQVILLENGEFEGMGTFKSLINISEKFKNSVALQNI
ncbi:ABC transporter ATP-binding protein [Litoribacter alkaliphilus]|uniref:ABC transporter ATP-binding protein n=1 Tax=Litoribacter ruber TaxID=702568 RepID=A0AAP2G6E0_9BACT|nr:ABC transporter ATP-binding protein [Litoribacter alkaliphilus]MBS9525593.1 ABC transporter ATP-binding protein [Litoribacter alkaliphilus]